MKDYQRLLDYYKDCFALVDSIHFNSEVTHESDVDRETIRHFFEAVKPDVMHVHTLMGLPIEVLQEAKSQGIRIVYTSHDYFGLCPKVNFINHLGGLCEGASAERCAICNSTAKWRPWMLWLRNSKLGVSLKKLLR